MKKGWKKSQASMEFLVVFGFVFLMMIPLIVIFFDQTGYVQDTIGESQIRNIMLKIVNKAESVYYTGGSSKTTIKAYLPEGVQNINISSRTIRVIYLTKKGIYHNIEAGSLVNMTGTFSVNSGIHNILIESDGGAVSISEG